MAGGTQRSRAFVDCVSGGEERRAGRHPKRFDRGEPPASENQFVERSVVHGGSAHPFRYR